MGPVWRSKAPLAAATLMMAPSGANEPRTTRILPGGPSGWLTGLIASVVLGAPVAPVVKVVVVVAAPIWLGTWARDGGHVGAAFSRRGR